MRHRSALTPTGFATIVGVLGCMLWSCAHSVEDGGAFGPGTGVDGGSGTANAGGSSAGAAGQGAMAGAGGAAGTGASAGTGATAGFGGSSFGGAGGGTGGSGGTTALGGSSGFGGTGATAGFGGTGATGGTGGYGGTGGTGGYGGTGATGGTGAYGGTGGGACEISSSDPVCDSCLQSQCYYECAACSINFECLGLLDCINACFDDFCVEECTWYYPDGVDDLLDLLGSTTGCVTLTCAYECG